MSSPDPRLFIWPKLPRDHKKVLAVKRVVEQLGLPYGVKPFWYDATTSEEARRVLVLEDGFENGPIVNYIHPQKLAQLSEAVEWALGLRESRGARDSVDTLKRIFGPSLGIWDEVRMGDEWVRVGDEHPCGDYPAPCNCDDSETHDGRKA